MNNQKNEGMILKCVGGVCTVLTDNDTLTAQIRGIFRKNGETPLPGDNVTLTYTSDGVAVVESICSRTNFLLRPAVANIKKLCIVTSISDPLPNTVVLDRMTAIAAYTGIEAVIFISKSELAQTQELEKIYLDAGYTVYVISKNNELPEKIYSEFTDGIIVLTGNTGVGKSSLLNRLEPGIDAECGETSKKLGRGRHTTRKTELFRSRYGGYIADTPGFSSLDFESVPALTAKELSDCFPEFAEYTDGCRFSDCAHVKERDCGVRAAVEAGKISNSRYESFCILHDELARKNPYKQSVK